jgi:metal-responsive CopG/Arc/MetJ family transcriptional regulator
MKTAISIPDTLFDAAEQYAQQHGLSRSELYVQALQHYLRSHRYVGVTNALNQIYDQESSQIDPTVVAAQLHAVEQDNW